MKTNNLMTREEFIAIQRTVDGYFNTRSLLNQFLIANPTSKKSLITYKAQKSVQEYIKYLSKEENIEQPLIVSRGRNATTWMHPLLMIDFAMYLSLEFKTTVLKWALDGLIKARHDAGNYYLEMCATIQMRHIEYYGRKASISTFQKEARKIKGILKINETRNNLTEQELNNIVVLQRLNAELLELGVGKCSRYRQLEIVGNSFLR